MGDPAMKEALGLVAQGWHGPDVRPFDLRDDGEVGLVECFDDGLVVCFEVLGPRARLADHVLPRRYVYLLTEKGRAKHMRRLTTQQ